MSNVYFKFPAVKRTTIELLFMTSNHLFWFCSQYSNILPNSDNRSKLTSCGKYGTISTWAFAFNLTLNHKLCDCMNLKYQ